MESIPGLLKSLKIPSMTREQKENGDYSYPMVCAGIFKQSMGARNRVGIGLSYRPARAENLSRTGPPEPKT